jgi:hypothetical protein
VRFSQLLRFQLFFSLRNILVPHQVRPGSFIARARFFLQIFGLRCPFSLQKIFVSDGGSFLPVIPSVSVPGVLSSCCLDLDFSFLPAFASIPRSPALSPAFLTHERRATERLLGNQSARFFFSRGRWFSPADSMTRLCFCSCSKGAPVLCLLPSSGLGLCVAGQAVLFGLCV